MSQHYHCDACDERLGVGDKYHIWYIFPMSENVSKFELCPPCMKTVTRFMKSLKEKK